VCVWCVYACILGIDNGDPLGCKSLCYEWGGSSVQGSSRRICLWGCRWIGGLGLSGGKCEGLIWEWVGGKSPITRIDRLAGDDNLLEILSSISGQRMWSGLRTIGLGKTFDSRKTQKFILFPSASVCLCFHPFLRSWPQLTSKQPRCENIRLHLVATSRSLQLGRYFIQSKAVLVILANRRRSRAAPILNIGSK